MQEDLNVSISEDTREILVNGCRPKEDVPGEDQQKRCVSMRFPMPRSADLKHTKAKLENGVLKVEVPKMEGDAMRVTID